MPGLGPGTHSVANAGTGRDVAEWIAGSKPGDDDK